MASLHTLGRRVAALEARLTDVEGGYGETIYDLHRRTVKTELGIGRLLDHFGIAQPSDEEVDEVIEQE